MDAHPPTLPGILGVTLGNTLGAFQIGVAISLILFGVVTLQVYYYYEHYESDQAGVKASVAFIWLLELAHSILIMQSQYTLTSTPAGYGTYSFLRDLPITTKVSFLCSTILSFIFSNYCAYRIRLMTKRWEFPVFCFIVSLARAALTTAVLVLLLISNVDLVLRDHKKIALAGLILGFLLDMIISLVLCYLLLRAPGNFARGERTPKRLLLFAVESGFFSFLLGVPMVVWVSGNTFNFIWLALIFIIAKVNSNSILVTLNSRQVLPNSYAVPTRNSRVRPFEFSFTQQSDNVVVAKSQVTTTGVPGDDQRSLGRDYGLSKNDFTYPPRL